MGIEKLVPTYEDIEVISQLLPRSATGERHSSPARARSRAASNRRFIVAVSKLSIPP